MKYLLSLIFSLVFSVAQSQEVIYEDRFDNQIFSVGNVPAGYTQQLDDATYQITGTGVAGPYAALTYFMHSGGGSRITIDASASPKLYIRARGENQPTLRIDFQDESGYVTNQNPLEVRLEDNYKIYELDYNNHLSDGAFGGPCTNGPCPVDPSRIQGLVLFVNAANGDYSGTIDIDWISIGAPIENIVASTYEIRYNQISYLTNQNKLISFADNVPFDDVSYRIYLDGETTPVMEGQISSEAQWQPSREYIGTVDFSSINTPGNYSLLTADQTINFKITQDGYQELCEASLKYYYYNRASQELTSEYAGTWARPLGHPDDEVLIHASAASTARPTGTIISAPKGWYDAGDYNKYIVNSGISTYTLLAAYEHYPDYYKDLSIDIPEQGGDLPDVLDEITWNLDWMMDMQDPNDGGVYHKLTGLNFSGIIMPHQYNATRYVVQKTTAATLNFAAVAAVASRVYAEYESVRPGYSAELLEASIKAYDWALANPTIYYNQPSNVRTGEYGDNNVNDEFDWAAAELFITTRDQSYKANLNESQIGNGVPAWPYAAPLALISLAHHADALGGDINNATIRSRLLVTANQLRSEVNDSPMHVAMGNSDGDFVWGSNGQAGNQIMILIRAYELTSEDSYLEAAYTAMDYLLGRNGTGYCYVSGFGDKSPRRPHHRQSEADNVGDPVPGMVAGGPNPGQHDGCSGYVGNEPALSYVDSWCSYASNEVTINWNAPMAYAINALQFYQQKLVSTDEALSNDVKLLSIRPNPGSNSVFLSQLSANSGQRLQVVSLSGQILLELSDFDSKYIDVSSLPAGAYLFRLSEDDKVFTSKWIKID